MSAVWSAQQRRFLHAMGFELYRLAGAPRETTSATHPTVEPLLRALLRAAGRDPQHTDAAAWMREAGIPPLAGLRADPSAKRALWPRLRAMRGQRDSA